MLLISLFQLNSGQGTKKVGITTGSGIGLLTGIGLPATPLGGGVGSVTGVNIGIASTSGTSSLTAVSSSGLHNSTHIGAPPKSSPSPFERTYAYHPLPFGCSILNDCFVFVCAT
jgi:hypothetical protein